MYKRSLDVSVLVASNLITAAIAMLWLNEMKCLLLLLLVHPCIVNGEKIFIVPSQDSPCTQDVCITLSQLTANSSGYFSNDTQVSILFLPGNHSLDTNISFNGFENISMIAYSQDNESQSVYVECQNQSGGFNVSETNFVLIQNLYFSGCGGDTLEITQVEQFYLQDIIFHGTVSQGRALVMNNVSTASISDSLFYHCRNTIDNGGGAMVMISSCTYHKLYLYRQ